MGENYMPLRFPFPLEVYLELHVCAWVYICLLIYSSFNSFIRIHYISFSFSHTNQKLHEAFRRTCPVFPWYTNCRVIRLLFHRSFPPVPFSAHDLTRGVSSVSFSAGIANNLHQKRCWSAISFYQGQRLTWQTLDFVSVSFSNAFDICFSICFMCFSRFVKKKKVLCIKQEWHLMDSLVPFSRWIFSFHAVPLSISSSYACTVGKRSGIRQMSGEKRRTERRDLVKLRHLNFIEM